MLREVNYANEELERNSHEVAKRQYPWVQLKVIDQSSGISHEVVEQNYA